MVEITFQHNGKEMVCDCKLEEVYMLEIPKKVIKKLNNGEEMPDIVQVGFE